MPPPPFFLGGGGSQVVDGAQQMGILRQDVDRTSIEIVARAFLEEFQKTLKDEDAVWENELSPEEQLAIRKVWPPPPNHTREEEDDKYGVLRSTWKH